MGQKWIIKYITVTGKIAHRNACSIKLEWYLKKNGLP